MSDLEDLYVLDVMKVFQACDPWKWFIWMQFDLSSPETFPRNNKFWLFNYNLKYIQVASLGMIEHGI